MSRLSQSAAIILLISLTSYVENSKILGLFPMCTHSHYMTGFALAKELALRGHEVTFVSCYALKEPIKNFRNIHIEGMKKAIHQIQSNLHGLQSQPVIATSMAAHELGFILTEKTLSYPPFQKILHSNESFDLVMTEEFAIPGLLGVAAHFNAKSMLVNSLRTGTWSNYYFGNPEEPSTIPYVFSRYVPPMSLLERCRNLLDIIAEYFMREWIMLPKQDEILHKYLPHVPKVQELVRSQSLMLVNSHVSFELPVPMLPNIVEIGGYHVEEPKPLQKDLKKVLDEAEDGIIFFSLGTNIQSSDLKTQKIEAVINVFSKLKQIVLWKYENQSIVNKPRNLLTGSWFPQNDILAHPNLRAFISHGGMMSSIEAVYHGIPILGLPFFADQHANIERAVKRGYAIKLSSTKFNEDEFLWSLNELIYNPKYRRNAKLWSKLMRDRPMKPMDTAVYWVEYVIRNGGEQFKSDALEQHWYQRVMLDVLFAFALGLISLLYITKILLRNLTISRVHKEDSKKTR